MTASRDRLRGLAEVLGRREAAGEAAGYDRLRAEREVIEIEADLTAARADRARAQAALAAFFAPTTDPATLVAAVPPAGIPRQALPTAEELVAHAESQLPELSALKHEQESASLAISAAGRRPIPEPEIVAGTKSSNVAGGDVGTVFSVHVTIPLFDHAKPEQTLAQARRAQADARIAAFQAVLHADVAALRTIVLERRQAADSYRTSTATSAAQLERIAQVSYDAGERSILELVDAYRNSGSTRLRQVALDVAVRRRRNRARTCERMGDPMMKRTLPVALIVSLLLATACRRGTTGAGQGAVPEEHTLDVTSWTQQTELFMEHPPLVAGQTIRFAVHLTKLADFQALNAGRPSIELSPISGGTAVILPGSEPLRPGAFRVEGKLPPAGQYRWALLVNAPGLSDRHDLGSTTVFADEATASRGRGETTRTGCGGDRLSQGAAVDESVFDGCRARRRCAHVDSCAGRH